MPAYEVNDSNSESGDAYIWCYVMAINPASAIAEAKRWECTGDLDITDCAVVRRPELDDGITEAKLHHLNRMFSECNGCQRFIKHGIYYGDDDEEIEAFTSPNGRIFCSEECYQAHTDRDAKPHPDGICLYADF